MGVFSFDASFQRAILRLCMVDDAFCLRALQWLEPSYFTSPAFGWVFKEIDRYWQEYQMRCTEIPLRQALQQLPDDKRALYSQELEAIVALGLVPEADYIRHELSEYCKRAMFADTHQQAAVHFNQGQFEEAYSMTAAASEKMAEIDFGAEDRQWFFDELGDRQVARWQNQSAMRPEPFFTGIHDLDERTNGGVHLGELWVVFAYAKRGKSTWLINQGYNALNVMARPVLHIVLEGSGSQIAARYDAIFSQELYTNVKHGTINPTAYKAMHERYARLKKKLVIRTLNDWDVNVLHIQAEMAKLKAQNFKPELLLVDYMDLLRSRTRCDSETQHQVNAARDLKRLVNQEQVACWSAWQAQRPKSGSQEREHVLTSSNVADAYAKVRIVDAYGSLNATDAEMEEGRMRVYMEGHRDAPIGRLYTIRNDLSTMRMITSVEGPGSSLLPPPDSYKAASS
jgi:replicative DNA helicase